MAKKPRMGVFLALTFADAIYKDYPNVHADLQSTVIQNLIITLREDGYFGFLGGTADAGETELQALSRECKEEGNVDLGELIAIAHFNNGKMSRVCEHTLKDGFKVILYHLEITKSMAKDVIRKSVDAEHFFTETAGLNSVAIHHKSSFAKNAFLSCMHEEFIEIGTLIRSEILKGWGEKIN